MPQHTREVINHRRQEVAALYLTGKYQTEIARLVGCSQQPVSHDLKAVQREWLASSIRDFDTVKSEQLAKIDAVERAAWGAWERSCQQREITVQEVIDGETRTKKVTLRKEQQVGDPRFLERIQKCIDQRCDILGTATSTEAAKALGSGLAALLAQAHGPELPPAPMAEA
jgi:hypothetical protein